MAKELITNRMSRQQYEELLAGHIFHLTGLPYRAHPRNNEKIVIPASKYFEERMIEPLQLSTTLGAGHWNVRKETIDAYYNVGADAMAAAKDIIKVFV